MGSQGNHSRTGMVAVLTGFMIGPVLGVTGCGTGDGDTSTLPSPRASERSIDRPASAEPDGTRSPTAQPTRTDAAQASRSREPDRTATPAETTAPAADLDRGAA